VTGNGGNLRIASLRDRQKSAKSSQKQPLGCPLSRQVCLLPESREKIWAFVSLGRDEIDLHEKGIYFRSMHLANVILTPDGTLGLIDISDMKTFHRPPAQLQARAALRAGSPMADRR